MWNRDFGMPLAFEATIFPYFEKAVVQTAQNKAQLRILGQHLSTADSCCVSALVLSQLWAFRGSAVLPVLVPTGQLRMVQQHSSW